MNSDSIIFERMAPITTEFGFVRVPASRLERWLSERETRVCGSRCSIERVTIVGSLEERLSRLLPLTTVERRRALVLPTRSDWSAYFDNGVQGADAAGLAAAASDLHCEAVRVVAAPDTVSGAAKAGALGSEGARIFELYGPNNTDFLNYVRTISVARDGGRWRFDQAGQPLGSEEPSWFAARAVRDRFPLSALAELLSRIGIDAFDESFYIAGGTLIERRGPLLPGCREFGLGDLYKLWSEPDGSTS